MEDLEIKGNYDLFSKQISLYFKGRGSYSTLFGKIATVIYIILYLIFLVIYSLLGILKKHGIFNSEDTVTTELPNLTLSKNKLYFAYSLEDPMTFDNIRDDEIYYTEAYYKHAKREGEYWTWEEEKLEVGPCELEYFDEKYRNHFLLKPYKTFTCIKNINQNLFGNYIYDDYSYIYVRFFPCVNDTEHHCKPQEIIDEYLNGTFVDFILQSVYLNTESYKNPVKENLEDFCTTLGRGFKRALHIYYKIIDFKDYGFFGESLEKKKYVQYDYTNSMIVLNSDSSLKNHRSICDVSIKLSEKTLIVKREYNTLIENYSKIGGIMDLILKIISVISFFLVSTLYDINVVNDLFQFYKKKKEIKGIKKQNFFRIGSIGYCNKSQNSNSKIEFKNLKPIYEKKTIIENKQKYQKNRLSTTTNKNICTSSTIVNDLNSKDYILNNIISNIPHVKNNIDINNNDIIDDLNKKYNSKNKENNKDELEIIKEIKLNLFNLFLFSLFPNKVTNKNSNLLKIGLCKFREELDIARLFRIGLLNNKSVEILKNNSSLLSFNKEDLIINKDILYAEEKNN